MKVYKSGKEVKDAKVLYYAGGQPYAVQVAGTNYDPSAFELKEDEPAKKTRTAPKSKTKSGDAMTTKNTGKRNK